MKDDWNDVLLEPLGEYDARAFGADNRAHKLAFCHTVETYKKMNFNDRILYSRRIYEDFLTPESGGLPVVDGLEQKRIKEGLNRAHGDLFDNALMMVRDDLIEESNAVWGSSASMQENYQGSYALNDYGIQNQCELTTGPFTISVWWKKTCLLTPLAMPVMATQFTRFSLTLILYAMVGRLGLVEGAAAGLANMYVNVTGYSFCTGVLGAIDSLIPQALGACNPRRVSLILYRSLLVLFVLMLPVMGFWAATKPLLLVIGQEEDVAHLAAHFVFFQIPGLPFYITLEALKKYLQCQGIVKPGLLTVGVVNFICTGLGYFLIFHSRLGFYGFPVALLASNVLACLALIGTIIVFKIYESTYAPFSLRSCLTYDGVIEFLRLGFPGAAMVCAEWIGFEIHSLLSGLLSKVILNAQVILINTNFGVYMISFGMGTGLISIVGNELGSGLVREAKHSTITALINVEVCVLLISALLLGLHEVWGKMFTNDVDVIQLVSQSMPIMTLFLCSDAALGVFSAILHSSGKQKIGAILNLVTYYLIGLPLAVVLAFPWGAHFGLPGLWIGLACASWLSTVILMYIIYRSDWSKWSNEVIARSSNNSYHSPNDAELVLQ